MTLKQILANWEEYTAIQTWKKGLKYNSHKNKLSLKTLESMRTWMPLFLEYTQKNPDELIAEALNGKETIKARLSDFLSWLQEVKGKKYNSSVNGSYSVIRGFYSHNDINTQKIRMPSLEPTQVQFSDDNVPMFDIIEQLDRHGESIKKKQLRREFLKTYLEYLNPRDKIIATCLISSGLDSSDILTLPLALVRYQDADQKRIFIRDLRNKTGESVTTFFSVECTKILRNYVNTVRKHGLDSEPIFVKSTKELRAEFFKKHGHQYDPTLDEFEVFSLDSRQLATNFRDSIKRYNQDKPNNKILIEDNKQSPLRPKRFRKIFNDACDAAGIPIDIKRVFMGKKDASNKPYEGKSRQDLELYYELVEPNITIYSEPAKSNPEIFTLRKQIENLQDQLKRKDDMATNAILDLQQKVAELEKKQKS